MGGVGGGTNPTGRTPQARGGRSWKVWNACFEAGHSTQSLPDEEGTLAHGPPSRVMLPYAKLSGARCPIAR